MGFSVFHEPLGIIVGSQSEVSVLFPLNICGIFLFELSGGIAVRILSSFTFYLQFYEVLKNETQFVT